MERKVKAVQYGCGKMSVYLMRYLMEKGADLVAAFDMNPAVIGKDIGEIIGDGKTYNVKVSDAKDFDAMLKELKPDVCVVATRSTMADIKESFEICARNGVNAISTCEEAVYPWNSSPAITKELDELAKQNNCTLTGVGYPEMYWGVLISTLASSMQTITKIEGSSNYNVEDYGIALAEGHGAGFSLDKFDKELGVCNDWSSDEIKEKVESGEYVPSYMWNQNGWLCSKFGLTITSQTQKCIPITYDKDLKSDTLGVTVKAGDAIGMRAIVTTTTAQGITLETENIGKIYTPEDHDVNDWTLHGEPDTSIVVNKPATVELTCSNLVSRIPALINATPGYVTTDKFPEGEYLVRPMNEYVK